MQNFLNSILLEGTITTIHSNLAFTLKLPSFEILCKTSIRNNYVKGFLQTFHPGDRIRIVGSLAGTTDSLFLQVEHLERKLPTRKPTLQSQVSGVKS